MVTVTVPYDDSSTNPTDQRCVGSYHGTALSTTSERLQSVA